MQTSIHSLHSGTSAAYKYPFQRNPAIQLRSASSARSGLSPEGSTYPAQAPSPDTTEVNRRPSPRTDIGHRFGLRLRELRRERNLTQVRMAAEFGIDRSFISDVERGKKSLSLPMLEVIALGMKMSLSELLRDI